MTLEQRIQAITGNDNYRLSLDGGGFGITKYNLTEEGQRGIILSSKTAQELIDWAIAKVQNCTVAPVTYEIDLVHSMREEMVLDTISRAKWLPRNGEEIVTERGIYRAVKISHDYTSERVYISVVESDISYTIPVPRLV